MFNPMSEAQITESLKGLPGWAFGDNKLHKIYKFNDFREAMAFWFVCLMKPKIETIIPKFLIATTESNLL